LNNTPAISRSSYIHPQVIALHDTPEDIRASIRNDAPDMDGLRRAEAQLLYLLSSQSA